MQPHFDQKVIDFTKVLTLRRARAVLTDFTSYDDAEIYDAALQLALCGESEEERRRALVLVDVLGASH